MQDNSKRNSFFDKLGEDSDDDSQKTGVLSVFVTISVAVLVGAGTCGLVLFFSSGSSRPFSHNLCNGLFFAGVLLSGIGGLSVITKSGFFDVVQFGFRQMGDAIKSGLSPRAEKPIRTDFATFRSEKYSKRKALWHWVFVGIGYIIIAAVVLSFT